MTHDNPLSAIDPEDLEMIVSLPYRVGIWMSEMDDDGGTEDDAREIDTLETLIVKIADLHADTPVVQMICKETVRLRASWPNWADRSFDILDDCARAVDLVDSKITRQAAHNYRAALLEIASSVARAWGEFGSGNIAEKRGLLNTILTKLSVLSPKDQDHPSNISPAEDNALSQLAAVMKIPE